MVTNLQQFYAVGQKRLFETNLHYIWCKFSIKNNKILAGTAPSNGAILDEFSEQKSRFSAHFSWAGSNDIFYSILCMIFKNTVYTIQR